MPDKLRAGGSFPYILESDREQEQKPQFQIAVLSAADNDAVIELRDQFIAIKDKSERTKTLQSILERCVKSVCIEGYGVEDLRELLTERECWELASAAINGAALTPEERKKFVLPPQSETDSSVNDAEAVSA